MAIAPPRACWCGKRKPCSDHQPLRQRSEEGARNHRLYQDRRWQEYARGYLAAHPLCVDCQKRGIFRAATEVDHIIPHRGDLDLFWRTGNHQGLCHCCHSAKTMRELNARKRK